MQFELDEKTVEVIKESGGVFAIKEFMCAS